MSSIVIYQYEFYLFDITNLLVKYFFESLNLVYFNNFDNDVIYLYINKFDYHYYLIKTILLFI